MANPIKPIGPDHIESKILILRGKKVLLDSGAEDGSQDGSERWMRRERGGRERPSSARK